MFLGTPEEPRFSADVPSADPAVFRNAMRRFATTVSIITCTADGIQYGMSATAVASLSSDPPALLVCINKSAATHRALCRGGHFCVNILRSSHAGMSQAFSGQFRGEDRFKLGGWQANEEGLPILQNAQANLLCETERTMEYSTHTVFIARVYAARVQEAIDPLIYQDGRYVTATPIAL